MRMKLALALVAWAGTANAAEIKLDEAWAQKLGQLCAAAQYGSRMTAEPICEELGAIFAKARQEEKKKEEKK